MIKAVVALCIIGAAYAGVIAPIPATTLVRTPHLDSAVIKSDRLGGNFAYSTVEGHAYSAISPVIQNIPTAVGVSYTAHQVPIGVGLAPVGPAVLPAIPAGIPAIPAAAPVVSAPVVATGVDAITVEAA